MTHRNALKDILKKIKPFLIHPLIVVFFCCKNLSTLYMCIYWIPKIFFNYNIRNYKNLCRKWPNSNNEKTEIKQSLLKICTILPTAIINGNHLNIKFPNTTLLLIKKKLLQPADQNISSIILMMC
jgi:hypothetical protein